MLSLQLMFSWFFTIVSCLFCYYLLKDTQTHVCLDARADAWTNAMPYTQHQQAKGWMNGWKDARMHRRMHRRMHIQMDAWMDRQKHWRIDQCIYRYMHRWKIYLHTYGEMYTILGQTKWQCNFFTHFNSKQLGHTDTELKAKVLFPPYHPLLPLASDTLPHG